MSPIEAGRLGDLWGGIDVVRPTVLVRYATTNRFIPTDSVMVQKPQNTWVRSVRLGSLPNDFASQLNGRVPDRSERAGGLTGLLF